MAEELKAAGKAPPWLAEDLGEIAVMTITAYESSVIRAGKDEMRYRSASRYHQRTWSPTAADRGRFGQRTMGAIRRASGRSIEANGNGPWVDRTEGCSEGLVGLVAVAEANAALGVS